MLKYMPQSKSKRKNLDTKVLDEIKRLRDDFRRESARLMFRDLGVIVLTVGGLLTAFSLSFVQLRLVNLAVKTSIMGFLLFFSGLLFILSSLGPYKKPSRQYLHHAFKLAKKSPLETFLIFLAILILVISFIISIVLP
jgi:uncharacterized membrane protein YesL